jgi:hypothetical protein
LATLPSGVTADETPGFGFFFSRFVLLHGLVTNQNKFFNTTHGEAKRPGVGAECWVHGATEEPQEIPVRTTNWRRGPGIAFEAYAVQLAGIVAPEPASGKEAATGLNVSADKTIIPEHGYSLGFITNGKHISCWRAAEFIGHTSIRRYR